MRNKRGSSEDFAGNLRRFCMGFEEIWVAEWPPFGKKLPTLLAICSPCIMSICNIYLFPALVLRAGFSFLLLQFLFIAFLLLLLAELLWLCSVAAPKSLPAHPFNALIFPIPRGCVQSFVIFLSLNCIVGTGAFVCSLVHRGSTDYLLLLQIFSGVV